MSTTRETGGRFRADRTRTVGRIRPDRGFYTAEVKVGPAVTLRCPVCRKVWDRARLTASEGVEGLETLRVPTKATKATILGHLEEGDRPGWVKAGPSSRKYWSYRCECGYQQTISAGKLLKIVEEALAEGRRWASVR